MRMFVIVRSSWTKLASIAALAIGWWWTDRQLDNLRTILDRVKRAYNVDENRVVLSGVSDGGTGTYYVAMQETTPFASFQPMNGSMMVLSNDQIGVDGDLYPTNLRNKPLLVVNGGTGLRFFSFVTTDSTRNSAVTTTEGNEHATRTDDSKGSVRHRPGDAGRLGGDAARHPGALLLQSHPDRPVHV